MASMASRTRTCLSFLGSLSVVGISHCFLSRWDNEERIDDCYVPASYCQCLCRTVGVYSDDALFIIRSHLNGGAADQILRGTCGGFCRGFGQKKSRWRKWRWPALRRHGLAPSFAPERYLSQAAKCDGVVGWRNNCSGDRYLTELSRLTKFMSEKQLRSVWQENGPSTLYRAIAPRFHLLLMFCSTTEGLYRALSVCPSIEALDSFFHYIDTILACNSDECIGDGSQRDVMRDVNTLNKEHLEVILPWTVNIWISGVLGGFGRLFFGDYTPEQVMFGDMSVYDVRLSDEFPERGCLCLAATNFGRALSSSVSDVTQHRHPTGLLLSLLFTSWIDALFPVVESGGDSSTRGRDILQSWLRGTSVLQKNSHGAITEVKRLLALLLIRYALVNIVGDETIQGTIPSTRKMNIAGESIGLLLASNDTVNGWSIPAQRVYLDAIRCAADEGLLNACGGNVYLGCDASNVSACGRAEDLNTTERVRPTVQLFDHVMGSVQDLVESSPSAAVTCIASLLLACSKCVDSLRQHPKTIEAINLSQGGSRWWDVWDAGVSTVGSWFGRTTVSSSRWDDVTLKDYRLNVPLRGDVLRTLIQRSRSVVDGERTDGRTNTSGRKDIHCSRRPSLDLGRNVTEKNSNEQGEDSGSRQTFGVLIDLTRDIFGRSMNSSSTGVRTSQRRDAPTDTHLENQISLARSYPLAAYLSLHDCRVSKQCTGGLSQHMRTQNPKDPIVVALCYLVCSVIRTKSALCSEVHSELCDSASARGMEVQIAKDRIPSATIIKPHTVATALISLAFASAERMARASMIETNSRDNIAENVDSRTCRLWNSAVRQTVCYWMSSEDMSSRFFDLWFRTILRYSLGKMRLMLVEDALDASAEQAASAFFDGDHDTIVSQTIALLRGSQVAHSAAKSENITIQPVLGCGSQDYSNNSDCQIVTAHRQCDLVIEKTEGATSQGKSAKTDANETLPLEVHSCVLSEEAPINEDFRCASGCEPRDVAKYNSRRSVGGAKKDIAYNCQDLWVDPEVVDEDNLLLRGKRWNDLTEIRAHTAVNANNINVDVLVDASRVRDIALAIERRDALFPQIAALSSCPFTFPVRPLWHAGGYDVMLILAAKYLKSLSEDSTLCAIFPSAIGQDEVGPQFGTKIAHGVGAHHQHTVDSVASSIASMDGRTSDTEVEVQGYALQETDGTAKETYAGEHGRIKEHRSSKTSTTPALKDDVRIFRLALWQQLYYVIRIAANASSGVNSPLLSTTCLANPWLYFFLTAVHEIVRFPAVLSPSLSMIRGRATSQQQSLMPPSIVYYEAVRGINNLLRRPGDFTAPVYQANVYPIAIPGTPRFFDPLLHLPPSHCPIHLLPPDNEISSFALRRYNIGDFFCMLNSPHFRGGRFGDLGRERSLRTDPNQHGVCETGEVAGGQRLHDDRHLPQQMFPCCFSCPKCQLFCTKTVLRKLSQCCDNIFCQVETGDCVLPNTNSSSQNQQRSRPAAEGSLSAEVFVVLIHGLRGSAWRTWRCSRCTDELVLRHPADKVPAHLPVQVHFNSNGDNTVGRNSLTTEQVFGVGVRQNESATRDSDGRPQNAASYCCCNLIASVDEESVNNFYYYMWTRQFLHREYPNCRILAVDYQAPLFREAPPFYFGRAAAVTDGVKNRLATDSSVSIKRSHTNGRFPTTSPLNPSAKTFEEAASNPVGPRSVTLVPPRACYFTDFASFPTFGLEIRQQSTDSVCGTPDGVDATDVDFLSLRQAFLGQGTWGATLEELSACIREQLRAAGVGVEKRPIVFIAHSMGGLLTQHMLLEDEGMRDNLAGIVFFATPHRGSPIASHDWIRLFKGLLPQYVVQLHPADRSVAELTDRFSEMINTKNFKHVYIAALAETHETKLPYIGRSMMVVPPSSALAPKLPFRWKVELPTDHTEVCKPATTRDIRFKIVGEVIQHAMQLCTQQGE